MKQADKQWCLEKAIDIIMKKAEGGAVFETASELEQVYKKLLELGASIWVSESK